jgi:aminoglycoside phosphotransferase (APT) family kinase protein
MASGEFAPVLLAQAVAGCLHVPPENLSFRRCATGKFNTTWFVSGGREPLVLRVAPPDDPARLLFYEYRMMRQEPGLHRRLRRETSIPVPAIRARKFWDRQDVLPVPEFPRDFLLMEQLPGRPLSETRGLGSAQVDRLMAAVGVCLRQCHALTGTHYGYAGPHRPMDPQSDWAGAFHVMWHKLLDDIERCGGYERDEALFLRRLLDRHRAPFERPVPAALLHMDVWEQNILVSGDGRLTGLLDWDRALYGDPEIEFAVLDYCGISTPAFWEGYGARREQSPEARVRHTFYFLYELQKYIFIRRVRGGSAAGADGYRREALRIARSLA